MLRLARPISIFALILLSACSRPPIGVGQGTGAANGGGDGDGTGNGNGNGNNHHNMDGGVKDPTKVDGGDGVVVNPDAGPVMVVKKSCGDWEGTDPWAPGYYASDDAINQAKAQVSAMSLPEKINQMHGQPEPLWQGDLFTTPDNTDRKIAGFRFRDGPRGVRLFEDSEKPKGATSFPVAALRAATFDRAIEHDIGSAIGQETLASGHNVILAPTINTLRHPGWGRGQETYGEDSFTLGKMGTAFIIGAQAWLPACVKHFAGNNIEDTRETNNAIIDPQTLHEVYLPHFRMAVEEGGVSCVMSAYNKLNGKYCSASPELLNDILRGQWHFQGFVVSDWNAAKSDTVGCGNAGLDVEMPNYPAYAQLQQSVESGAVSQDKIDAYVQHILEQKYRFNIASLDDPAAGLQPTQVSDIGSDEHTKLAYDAALEGITLLRNEGNVLPLDRSKVKKIAVVGTWAAAARLGDQGSSDVFPKAERVVPPYQGIKARAGNGVSVVTSTDSSAAAGADVAIVVAALTSQDEGEAWNNGGDRDTLNVSADQEALIREVSGMVDKTIVLLEGGGPITISNWDSGIDGIIMAWYAGEQGGLAMGDLIFGDKNFGGHVAMTWPKSWDDEPPFNNKAEETVMPFLHGYRYFDDKGIEPLYPFGYGLSYTTFKFSNLQVPCSDITGKGVIDVKVDVTNTGDMEGDAVAYLFVGYPKSKVQRAKKDLKGFQRVSLTPGQTKRLTIQLHISDLAWWNDANAPEGFEVEKTTYEIMVGGSSVDLPLKDSFVVK